MTRAEALRLLGLDEDATEADIKVAYKEMAQILHPDKYADNKKLSERANEQFKMVNEAREVLLGKRSASRSGGQSGRSGAGSGSGRSSGGKAGDRDRGYYDDVDQATILKARLAGIAAARTQLTAQLDAEVDRRRTGIYLTIAGVVGMILGEFFKMRYIEPFGGMALLWGVIQWFNASANVKTIQQHLDGLEKDRRKYEKKLNNL